MEQRQVILQGFLYTIIGAMTPVMALLSSDRELDQRGVITAVIAALIAGATALKAFLSTTYADSPESMTPGRALRMERKR